MSVLGAGHERLWTWFGMSYASFLVVPRVLMRKMPDEWQGKMAALLEEYEAAFPNQGHLPMPYVSAKRDRRFCSWPDWVLNYRRPNDREIDRLRAGAIQQQE